MVGLGDALRQNVAENPAQSRDDDLSLEELRARFKDSTRGRPCAVCGSRLFVEAHHVVYRQVVREICRESGINSAVPEWDTRNALPVCKVCHAQHHGRAIPIARVVLIEKAPLAFQFARELGPKALNHIKRAYPMRATT